MKLNQVYLGECLELMDGVQARSVDLILCDPPQWATTAIPFKPLWKQYNTIIKADGVIALFAEEPFCHALLMSNIAAFKYKIPMCQIGAVCIFGSGNTAFIAKFSVKTELKIKNTVAKFSGQKPKPVDLYECLIRAYTNEGDTVLDNCAGSGTTAIACMNTNRNYILMEKEKEYYNKCRLRIEEARDDDLF